MFVPNSDACTHWTWVSPRAELLGVYTNSCWLKRADGEEEEPKDVVFKGLASGLVRREAVKHNDGEAFQQLDCNKVRTLLPVFFFVSIQTVSPCAQDEKRGVGAAGVVANVAFLGSDIVDGVIANVDSSLECHRHCLDQGYSFGYSSGLWCFSNYFFCPALPATTGLGFHQKPPSPESIPKGSAC